MNEYQNVYQPTCTEEKAPDNSEVDGTLQNCVSSVLKWFDVTSLASRIWKCLLDFHKSCGPLICTE